jgi:hypothetical protein
MHRLRLSPFLALWALLAGGRAEAQFSVRGIVIDPSGLPVPAAHLALSQAVSGQQMPALRTTSGEDGSFRFRAPAQGEYTLEVARSGFETLRQVLLVDRLDIFVSVGLRVADVHERVQVQAAAENAVSLDPAENRDRIQVDRELLQHLPVMGSDALAAVQEFFEAGSVVNGDARIVVDGVETRNTRLQRSEIQEIRINRNPYSAEYSQPGRGRIEVITRQASPEYHGQLRFSLRDYRLDARNAFAAEKPPQQQRNYEGSLGGPLGRWRKNTFAVSLEREEDDRQAVIFARTVDRLIRQNAAQPQRETEFSTRMTRYHSDRHAFSWRYSVEQESESGAGVGGFTLPEAGYGAGETNHRLSFNHKWFVRPAVLAELSTQIGREREQVFSLLLGVRQTVVQDAFTSGGAQQDETAVETDFELSYTVSWTSGRHFVRTGILVPELAWQFQDASSNFDGTYVFASLEDYAAGRPVSFMRSEGASRLQYRTRELAAFVQHDMQVHSNVTLGIGARYDTQRFVGDRNNVAPRVSIAWGFGEKRKTVLRAGAGIFYDQLSSKSIGDALRFDGLRMRQILIASPSFPEPAGGELQSVPPGVVRLASGLRSPYLTQFSAAIERELPGSLALAVTYTGLRGTKLFRSLDRNAPLPPDYRRPDPAVQFVRQIESSANLKSHGLEVGLQGRFGRIFRGVVRYTVSRTHNHADGDSGLPPDSRDLSREWARAGMDRRHRLRLLGSWQLPGRLVAGTLFRADSGAPYEWTTGQDDNRDGRATERLLGVGRNALQGPAAVTLDLRLSREFQARPGDKGSPQIIVAFEAFNALNRVNITRVVGNQSSRFFGQPVAAGAARRMQVSLALEF